MGNETYYEFSDRYNTIYCVLTKKCNMLCRYCHVSKGNDQLDVESYIQRLKGLLKERQKTNIVFYGGEPLIQSESMIIIIDALMEHYADTVNQLSFSMNTNGTLITHQLARKLKECSLYPIVSLDGMTEENNTYRTFYDGTPAYERIIEGINILHEENVKFGISAVLHDKNKDSLKEFISYMNRNYCVDKIGINLIHNNENGFDTSHDRDFDDVTAILEIVQHAYTIGVEIPQYMPRINNFRKGIPNPTYCASCSMNKIILYPDYTVGRCENYASVRYDYASAHKIPALKLKFRDECKECGAIDICGGGCAPDMSNEDLRKRWCRLSQGLYAIALSEM